MGSPRSALSLVTTNTIMTMKAIEPIVDLIKDAYVQEKVEEAAKLFYTNDTVTVNLYWAAAAALLFFLLLIPLLALFFQPSSSSGEATELLLPATDPQRTAMEPQHLHTEVQDILTADLMTFTERPGPCIMTFSPLPMLTALWTS